MARRSVAVLNSMGSKIGYITYRAANADVDEGRATRESERCIRLLPRFDEAEWRRRKSGEYGPRVWQIEHPSTEGRK